LESGLESGEGFGEWLGEKGSWGGYSYDPDFSSSSLLSHQPQFTFSWRANWH